MRRHPEYRLAAIAAWERYAASVKGGGIMACWPCTTPVAWDLHCTSARTNPARARDALPAHRPRAGRLAAQEERKERDALDDLFVFTDDDKREFFRVQRERIHAGRRVDTTDGMRLIQTALRDWPAPHTIPARAPYGHASRLRRLIGGTNVPGEIIITAPTPGTCRERGHEHTPRDDGLLAYISHT